MNVAKAIFDAFGAPALQANQFENREPPSNAGKLTEPTV
jgi:hypothetical protein